MTIECPKCGYMRQAADRAPDTECPRCGVIFAKYLDALARGKASPWKPSQQPAPPPASQPEGPRLADRLSSAREAYAEAQAARAPPPAAVLICKQCGTLNQAGALPGNGWIEFVLWAVFLWPVALVYSIWRRAQRSRVCSACGSRELVGADTPIGRSLAGSYFPDGLPAMPPAPVSPPALGSRSFLIVLALIVALPVLMAVVLQGLPR